MKKLKLGEAIGKGAFGTVFRALHLDTGQVYAVKQIKTNLMNPIELRDIMSEIDLLKNLYHENIVSYQGFSQTSDHLNIIMEYCENGSLHSILQKFGVFPENLISLYIAQVLEGLEYLHEQDVIHRDIKAANILTTKAGTVKLADFGISSKLATGLSETDSIMGSPFWMPPEIIQLEGAMKSSDIWSVGCTVVELLEGKPPYYSLDPMSVLFNIVQDEHPPFPTTQISKELHDFLVACWTRDCRKRPSAAYLLKNVWIQKSQHKKVTARPKPSPKNVSTPRNTELHNKFSLPELQGQSEWDSDFLFDDDDDGLILEAMPCSPKKQIQNQTANCNTRRQMARIPTPVIPPAAENWDEDFDLDQELSLNPIPSLKLKPQPTKLTVSCTTPKIPPVYPTKSEHTENDYTDDFDFGDSTPETSCIFQKQTSSSLDLYTKQSTLTILKCLKQRKDVVDSCFELIAILDISPKLRETVISSETLTTLVDLLEHTKLEKEVLALMTLLNKLITDDVATKTRLSILGVVHPFTSYASTSKSHDIRREFLYFLTQMSSTAQTLSSLLAVRIWPRLLVYLEIKDSRTQEVAFDTLCCMAGMMKGVLANRMVVEDQVSVLCRGGSAVDEFLEKVKGILERLAGGRQRQDVWSAGLFLFSVLLNCEVGSPWQRKAIALQSDILKLMKRRPE